jgi:hypothetical protein
LHIIGKLSLKYMALLIAALFTVLTMALPLNSTSLDALSNTCTWSFSETICGSGVASQELVYPAGTTGCIPLTKTWDVKNVWTNKCSSWFGKFPPPLRCTPSRIDVDFFQELAPCGSSPTVLERARCESTTLPPSTSACAFQSTITTTRSAARQHDGDTDSAGDLGAALG